MLEDSPPSQGLPRVSVLKLRKADKLIERIRSEASEGTVRGGLGSALMASLCSLLEAAVARLQHLTGAPLQSLTELGVEVGPSVCVGRRHIRPGRTSQSFWLNGRIVVAIYELMKRK